MELGIRDLCWAGRFPLWDLPSAKVLSSSSFHFSRPPHAQPPLPSLFPTSYLTSLSCYSSLLLSLLLSFSIFSFPFLSLSSFTFHLLLYPCLSGPSLFFCLLSPALLTFPFICLSISLFPFHFFPSSLSFHPSVHLYISLAIHFNWKFYVDNGRFVCIVRNTTRRPRVQFTQ